jgi:hypothetical protein
MRSGRIRQAVVGQAAMEMDGLDQPKNSYHQHEEQRRIAMSGAACELAVRFHSVQMKKPNKTSVFRPHGGELAL